MLYFECDSLAPRFAPLLFLLHHQTTTIISVCLAESVAHFVSNAVCFRGIPCIFSINRQSGDLSAAKQGVAPYVITRRDSWNRTLSIGKSESVNIYVYTTYSMHDIMPGISHKPNTTDRPTNASNKQSGLESRITIKSLPVWRIILTVISSFITIERQKERRRMVRRR